LQADDRRDVRDVDDAILVGVSPRRGQRIEIRDKEHRQHGRDIIGSSLMVAVDIAGADLLSLADGRTR
jgi:hypothetical protein